MSRSAILILIAALAPLWAQQRPQMTVSFERARMIDVCEAVGRSSRMTVWYNGSFDREIRIDLELSQRDFEEVLAQAVTLMNARLAQLALDKPQLHAPARVSYRIVDGAIYLEQRSLQPPGPPMRSGPAIEAQPAAR